MNLVIVESPTKVPILSKFYLAIERLLNKI